MDVLPPTKNHCFYNLFSTQDETQVPAFKLAAWRWETMSEKWVTQVTQSVNSKPNKTKIAKDREGPTSLCLAMGWQMEYFSPGAIAIVKA